MGGEMKHLVVAKFKEGVVVEDIIKGMEELVSHLHYVDSFEWGEDAAGEEMLRQGFTHAFIMTFKTQEDFTAFLGHPKHVEFSATFSTAIEKVLLLDFPAVIVKPHTGTQPPPEADQSPPPPPPADPSAEPAPSDDHQQQSAAAPPAASS